MQLVVVSEAAFKKLQEEATMESLRIIARAESIDTSKGRLEYARTVNEQALAIYHEAILCLDPESDDWEVARASIEKLEFYERQFVDAKPVYEAALNRVGWEIREAAKAGIRL